MLAERSSFTKKFQEREALASRIERTSFEMFPCSCCEKNNTKCVVSDKENSSRCLKCVLREAKYNVKGILVGKWRSLELETNHLERERQAAFLALKAA
jgi:antirestriction protein